MALLNRALLGTGSLQRLFCLDHRGINAGYWRSILRSSGTSFTTLTYARSLGLSSAGTKRGSFARAGTLLAAFGRHCCCLSSRCCTCVRLLTPPGCPYPALASTARFNASLMILDDNVAWIHLADLIQCLPAVSPVKTDSNGLAVSFSCFTKQRE